MEVLRVHSATQGLDCSDAQCSSLGQGAREVRSDQVTAMLSERLPREVRRLHCIRGAAQETRRIFEETSPRHKLKPHWGKNYQMSAGNTIQQRGNSLGR